MKIIYMANVDMTKVNGAVEHIEGFIKAAEGNSIQVDSITADSIRAKNGKTISTPKILQLTVFNLSASYYVIRKYSESNVIYLRYSPFVIMPILAAKLTGKTCYIEMNGNVDNETLELFNAGCWLRISVALSTSLALMLSDRVVTVTEGLKRYYERKYPMCRGKVKSFSNAGVTGLKKRRRGFTNRGIYISSDVYWSSFDNAELLREQLKDNGIELVLQSSKDNPPVKFVGGDYDFGLLVFNENSRKLKDGISPMKYFTYLSYGIPVIAPDVPDINRLTVENKIGILYGKKEDIFKAVITLYQKADYEEMSDNAYSYIQNNCNWKIRVKEIMEWKAKQ